MDNKEIAKELTIAVLQKSYINQNSNDEQHVANQVAAMFKTLYVAVRDANKDDN